jgi:hypothetical protein
LKVLIDVWLGGFRDTDESDCVGGISNDVGSASDVDLLKLHLIKIPTAICNTSRIELMFSLMALLTFAKRDTPHEI